MPAAITAAVQSTSLGTNVTFTMPTDINGKEGYYCITSGGTLVSVATPNQNPPSNCQSSGGSNKDTPPDYIIITAAYTHTPIFPAGSLASALSSPITRTAWMRLG